MNTPNINRRRAAFVAGVLALGGLLAVVSGAQGKNSNNSPLTLNRDDHTVARGQLEKASFSDVVKRVSPSVVKITTETKAI